MSGRDYGMSRGDVCYVSMFSEQSLRNTREGYRVPTVTLDGDFTLGDLAKLASEFRRRLDALPPDLKATLREWTVDEEEDRAEGGAP